MNLASKSYRNNRTGDIVKVIDSFENIAILENKQKIDTRILMDPNQYTEQIDPSSFFNNQGAYNILAEKIKSIPISNLADEDSNIPVVSNQMNSFAPATNESAVIMLNEDDEKAELARKYGVSTDNSSALNRQNETFSKLLGEDGSEVQRFEVKRNNPEQKVNKPIENYNEPVQRIEVEDPIVKMFKGVKRNVDFNISIEINNKIPRLEFIELMEDSYEVSIIDFLSNEFTNQIISNPSIIRNMIKDKINSIVYKKNNRSINSQITDSVTQSKKRVSYNKKTTELQSEDSIKNESISWDEESTLSKEIPKKVTNRKSKTTKKESQ